MIWIELGFVNRIKLFEKCSRTRIFRTRFSQGKMVGLRLFTVIMIYKNVLDAIHEL